MRVLRLIAVAAAVLALGPWPAPARAHGVPAARGPDAAAFAGEQLARTAARLSPGAYPQATGAEGKWSTTGPGSWTSGFFPGALWLEYERTGDPAWRERAERWQAALEGQKGNTSTHDVGFMLLTPFGNAHRLTGDDAHRLVVLDAARSLAGRFNPVVGCTRSWNTSSGFRVIVDNMPNLELLFWAARHGGDPAWRDMGLSHALRTAEHHVRPDGSTYHVVDYDPETGAVLDKSTKQGLSRDSTWSRGQAWAVHGFATAYRETGDPRLLDAARRTADWFLAHLPADKVPYWDFAVSDPAEPRDSSAAAIAASGLVELGRRDPDPARASGYLDAARAIVSSLASSAYLARGTGTESVLLHGTYDRPGGRADSGLIWGDYYFLEALARLRAAGA